MTSGTHSTTSRYAVALGALVLALAVRLALNPILGSREALPVFTLAVILTARFSGRGPALLTTAVSVPLCWYFFVAPRYSLSIPNPRDAVGLLLLTITGVAASLLVGRKPDTPEPRAGMRGKSASHLLRHSALMGGALVLLIVFTTSLHTDFELDQDRQQQVIHTYEVLNATRLAMSNLEEAANCQRGYLLTGDESYLGCYRSNRDDEQALQQSLLALTAGDTGRRVRLAAFGALVDARFAALQAMIATRRSQGAAAAQSVDTGERIMEQCRAAVHVIETEERRDLAQRAAAADAVHLRTHWILGLGSGSLLLLLLVAATVIERDIRNRERTREVQRRSEERLRLALDAANAGTWEWDLQTNENVWSEELWKVYGIEPHSVTPSYEAWRQLVHPDDRARAERVVADAARAGTELNAEFRVCGAGGAQRWLMSRGRPMRDAEGQPLRFIGIVVDITQRKMAEEALRERERNLRQFAEVAPVAIAMFDRNMRYLAASQRFREDYHLGAQELAGRSHYEIFPEVPEEWRDIHRRCLEGAVERHTGEPFVRADGSTQWIRWEIQPWRQSDGAIGGLVLFSEEITRQMLAENAVRDSEARLRLAQQVARVGTFEWDIATGANTWTPELEAIYGLPPGGFEGTEQSWQGFIHPDDRPETLLRVREAMDTGRFDAEWRVVWPDGTIRWLAGRASVLKDEAGKPVRMIGVNIDITEQEATEEALHEASEQRRLALEAAELGAWDYDLATGNVFWDEKCRDGFGVPSGGVIDYAEAIARIHPDDRPATDLAVQQAVAGVDGGAYHREFRVVWPDGSVHWIASHGRVYFGDQDQRRQLRFIGVNMDITARKEADLEIRRFNAQLEERVRQRTADLETANNELEAFSYSVSHDLRAPLRGIDGWSLALAEDYAGQLDERAHQYLKRVRSETQHMGLLIDDMLQLSRVSRSEMRCVPVDLSTIAHGIAAGLTEAHPGRRIEFAIEPGVTVPGDAGLLEIALGNLLANAVKFTGPRANARIEFGRAVNGASPAFCVRDNGVGFDMQYADALFGPFQRLHRASEFPGTGIGLAIVQRVIHRHRGRVWAEAQPGRGAAFYFTVGATS